MRKCVIGLKELAFVLVAFVAGLNLVSLNVAGNKSQEVFVELSWIRAARLSRRLRLLRSTSKLA
jgi:hypothetical protein